ncbi:hypothetical protein VNI00_007273 [Paramarasmius palmivorus]|uniref:Uncharacterized protein n=1 Tax=Paramarasmius palmivorus TaxID=297713 RepID=A0AAW0D0R6_9AGAR
MDSQCTFHAESPSVHLFSRNQNPNITTAVRDRISIAKAALELAYDRLDSTLTWYKGEGPSGIWTAEVLHAELSLFDSVTNETLFKDRVKNYFEARGDGISNLPSPELSALLSEETLNTTYLDAAEKSLAFIRNNMFGSQGVVQSIEVRESCANPTLYDPIVEHAGLWIEGLSVLTSITGNSSMVDLIRNAVQVSSTRINGWQNDEGVMSEHMPILDAAHSLFIHAVNTAKATMISQGNFVRSLGIAYQRLTSVVDLRQYMRSYISVQYNAILERATAANSNIYGYWTGPPYSVFQSDNQTSAMNVLITAISLPEVEFVDGGSKPPVGGIIGGVVGGVVVAVLGIVALFFYRRRKKVESPEPLDENTQPDPFPQDTEPTMSTSSGPTNSTLGTVFSHVKGRIATSGGTRGNRPYSGSAPPPAYSDVT